MTANHTLHPQSDVDRLYLPRQTGGQGLLQVKQTVEEEKRALNDYIKNSIENYLKEVTKEEILKVQETKKEYHKQEITPEKKDGKVKRCMVSTSKISREKWTVTTPGTG